MKKVKKDKEGRIYSCYDDSISIRGKIKKMMRSLERDKKKIYKILGIKEEESK